MTSYQGGLSFDDTGALRVTSTGLKTALTAVIVGNSITALQQYNAAGIGETWPLHSEVQNGNALAGSPLKMARLTGGARWDAYGTYGYSGQTLPTVFADLLASYYPALRTAGVTPDIIVAGALLENDIAGGATTASMILSLTSFIRDAQARYPGVIILLATPHPSYSYDTAAKVSAYQTMVRYMQGLENGSTIFTATVNTYENPASPGTPLAGFTDASVHPNGKGAMRNARVFAATLRRIIAAVKQPYYSVGNNLSMSGSSAASGTNVTGTVPTSVTVTGSANGTFVVTAEQPGLLQTITANASGGSVPVDLSSANVSSFAYTGGASTQLSPFIEIEIVSGASNLTWFTLRPRYNDGTNNILTTYISYNTGDVAPELQNGDVFLFRSPPRKATDIVGLTGNFTAVQNYFSCIPALAGGTFSVRVRSQGIGVVIA